MNPSENQNNTTPQQAEQTNPPETPVQQPITSFQTSPVLTSNQPKSTGKSVKLIIALIILVLLVIGGVAFALMATKKASPSNQTTPASGFTTFTDDSFQYLFYKGSELETTPGTIGAKSLMSPAFVDGRLPISFAFSQRAQANSGTFKSCPANTLTDTVSVQSLGAQAQICAISSYDYFVFVPTNAYNYSFEFKLGNGTKQKNDLTAYKSDMKTIVGSIKLK